VQPAAVQPSAAKPRPVVQAAKPTKQLNEGDLICGQCGEGNEPTRKFCSRCGNSLQAAEKVHIPWWRRIIPKRRPKQARAAGEHQTGKKKKDRVSSFIALGRKLILGIGAAFAALLIGTSLIQKVNPNFKNPVTDKVNSFKSYVGDKASAAKRAIIPQFEPVHPTTTVGSSGIPQHEVALATDGFKNTFWSANGAADKQPFVIVTFPTAVNLAQLIVTSGNPADFQADPRPQTLHLVFSNGTSQDIILTDQDKPQTHALKGAKGVSKVEIHVLTTFPSPKGQNMSLAELEFFVKKN
jgi:hypothetical protein